jgi:hypothetical protein
LRALEYFQGILFLTTNRVGQFGEAFLSRIHVSIGYDPLDDEARAQIWQSLFRKLKLDHKSGGPEIRSEYEAKMYVQKNEDVKKLKWNGREIRNGIVHLPIRRIKANLELQLSKLLLPLLFSTLKETERKGFPRKILFQRSLKSISLKLSACQQHSKSILRIHIEAWRMGIMRNCWEIEMASLERMILGRLELLNICMDSVQFPSNTARTQRLIIVESSNSLDINSLMIDGEERKMHCLELLNNVQVYVS